MTYKDKLKAWNSTDKYRKELDFLYGLLDVKENEVILDFGCGIMTAINNFNDRGEAFFYGYDVEEYGEQDYYHLYDKQIQRKYDTIYFNHSIAHIQDPVKVLKALRTNLSDGGKIVIVTPNLEWLDKWYMGDHTIVKHYNVVTLGFLVQEAGYKIELSGQFGETRGVLNERIFIICK